MAKSGARLFFVNNPVEGDRLAFEAKINDINIPYINGQNIIDFEFTNNPSEVVLDPFHRILIGDSSLETLDNLLAFFTENNFYNSVFNIKYNKLIGESYPYMDMVFETTEPVAINDLETNDNLQLNSFVEPDTVNILKVKYILEYTNIVGDFYKLFILNKNYSGTYKNIQGKIKIKKNPVENHFSPLRGTGLSLEIEADETFSFDDLYEVEERNHVVRLEKNNMTIYNGYLNPEGAFQSYTRDKWVINIECVDGLAYLEGLSFTKTNGLPFNDKLSCMQIIDACLKKTGFEMRYKTYVNVYYEGLDVNYETTSILSDVYIDSERFVKGEDNSYMNCKEVLISVLRMYRAVVTQENGEWFIFRPSDLYQNPNPKLLYFTSDLIRTGWIQINLDKKIGSQIDNFYPHHCSGNQKLEVFGAISAFRTNYKFGFKKSFTDNPTFKHEAGTLDYPGYILPTWDERRQTGFRVIDPLATTGLSFKAAVADYDNPPILTRTAFLSERVDVLEGYSFEIKVRIISYGYPVRTSVRVTLWEFDGTTIGDSYSLDSKGLWSNDIEVGQSRTAGTLRTGLDFKNTAPFGEAPLTGEKYETTFSLKSEETPVDGYLVFSMTVPHKRVLFGEAPLVEFKSFEITNTFEGNNIVGEFHTATRIDPVNSITKSDDVVYSGDSVDDVYLGALYKEDKVTLTTNWFRKNIIESKPILRIAAEDELRIAQRASRKFSGDLYGQIPYLSLVEINKNPGKYLPIAYEFDTVTNICNTTLLELYISEIPNILYSKTNDYGETIKPTITG